MIVIASHGYLSSSESTTINTVCDGLKSRGIDCIKMNYPEELSEGKLKQSTPEEMLKKLREEVKKHEDVVLLGHSLGGWLSLILASEENVNAVVDIASPTELRDPLKRFSDEKRKQLETQGKVEYHRQDKDMHFVIPKEFFDQRASYDILSLATKIKCPVLIVHGSEDTAVPLDDSKQLFLQLQGKKDLCIIGGADHNFKNPEKRDAMVSAIVNWLEKLR